MEKGKLVDLKDSVFFESTNSQFFFASIHENQPQIMGLHGWDSILMITLVSRIPSPVRLFFVRIFFHPVCLIEILLYVYLCFDFSPCCTLIRDSRLHFRDARVPRFPANS